MQNNPTRDLTGTGATTRTPGSAYRSAPTTQSAYRSVPSASVYRSLEVPLAQTHFEVSKTSEKSHPHLQGPLATKTGEAFYHSEKPTLHVVASSEKEAKPMPIPLILANSPHNSVILKANPVSAAVDEVHKLLIRHAVDAEYNPEKFKWKCACYSNHTETRFVARVFSVPDKANFFVLDLSRRSGDPFHFQSIHRSIHNELLKSGFVISCNDEKAEAEIPIRTFKPLSLPADFFEGEKEEEKDAKEYEPICHMCESPYIDVQREGLTALASQLEQNESARHVLIPFSDKLIGLISRSRDGQVRRLAIASLALMASNSKFRLSDQEVQLLCKIVFEDSDIPETRRQAGNVLLGLSSSPSMAGLLRNVLVPFRNVPIIAKDSRLKEIMTKIQQI